MSNPLRNAKLVGDNVDPNVYGIDNALRGDPELVMRSSLIKEFAACPRKFFLGRDREETDALAWGDMIDCLALTPGQWERRFAICPETYPDKKTGEPKPWNFNAGYCKAWRDDRKDKAIVKTGEFESANSAVAMLYNEPKMQLLFDQSKKQVFVVAEFHDEETKLVIPIKVLIDLVPNLLSPWKDCLYDLKTCASIAERAFGKAVYDYGYHISAALYLDAYNAATGEERNDFRFRVQESRKPWLTGWRFLSSEFIARGRELYVLALSEYAGCVTSGDWPTYEERAAQRGELVIDGCLVVNPEAWMLGV